MLEKKLLQQDTQKEKVIESRFGTIKIQPSNKIYLPLGLLGLPNQQYFCLAKHNIANLKPFMVLQALLEDKLSLLVLPLELDNNFIDKKDIQEACQVHNINPKDLILLLTVSKKGQGDGILTVNVRAPILIDTCNMVGGQYILTNNEYKVQHPLGIG